MTSFRQLDRRTFLADLGRGAVALAVVGIAGCSPSGQATAAPTTGSEPPPTPGSTSGATPAAASGATPGATPAGSTAASGELSWERVNLGFVSAYLLVRGCEAALVDTGTFDSSQEIEASLRAVGLDWGAVAHVILTHKHSDHAGSIGRVLELAPDATAYIGAGDLAAFPATPLTPLADGDSVFGLSIVGTPGHTAGSMSVHDPSAGVLVAGDALGTDGGIPVLPSAGFTANMDEAKQSVVKLGRLTFETLLVGHGDPIESGASALVAELGAASG